MFSLYPSYLRQVAMFGCRVGVTMRWGNWVPHSTVLMLKPKVGEMVSTGSPLNLGIQQSAKKKTWKHRNSSEHENNVVTLRWSTSGWCFFRIVVLPMRHAQRHPSNFECKVSIKIYKVQIYEGTCIVQTQHQESDLFLLLLHLPAAQWGHFSEWLERSCEAVACLDSEIF